MFRPDRSLVGTEAPPLQEDGHAVHARHRDMSWVARGRDHGPLMGIAATDEAVVPRPTVGADHGNGIHHLTHERHQAGAGGIRDVATR
jgi:hypothetical protein